MLFHHDPLHTDEELDLIQRRAAEHWLELGGSSGDLAMAIEGSEVELLADGARPANGPRLVRS